MGLTNRLLSIVHLHQFQSPHVRHGHQMSTKWQGRQVIPKRRGLKCCDGELVHPGRMLCVQRYMKFFPGSNVVMDQETKTLIAVVPGTVKISCEVFDANFDHPLVMENYSGRKNMRMYKKYINVIPDVQHHRFKLVDVV